MHRCFFLSVVACVPPYTTQIENAGTLGGSIGVAQPTTGINCAGAWFAMLAPFFIYLFGLRFPRGRVLGVALPCTRSKYFDGCWP